MLSDTPVAFRKTSFVDYPGKISSVVFFPFCNMHCPWCHNGALISGKEKNLIMLEEAVRLIEKRVSVLGAVVLSGGEPLLYAGLGRLISRIKEFPLPVKLDTNGTKPQELLKLLENRQSAPDYVALDLKIAPARYQDLMNECCGDPEALLAQSVRILKDSGVPHEYRTTVLPKARFSEADVAALRKIAKDAPWYFHGFRPGNCLDPAWNSYPPVTPAEKARAEAAARD